MNYGPEFGVWRVECGVYLEKCETELYMDHTVHSKTK
jgi:hypothetical protein